MEIRRTSRFDAIRRGSACRGACSKDARRKGILVRMRSLGTTVLACVALAACLAVTVAPIQAQALEV